MQPNNHVRRIALLLLLLAVALTATSCAQAWDWLWSRDYGDPLDPGDMILVDGAPEEDTDIIFEGAVEYTGEAHRGTDIYYVGKKGSPNRSRIIVIDPGHQLLGSNELEPNGPNSEVMKAEVTWGAKGEYTGQVEYDLNLAVALLLRNELIRRGYSVVMIRETHNVSISNMQRAEIANKYNAAAYVRIHANSWTDSSMSGAMTICQSESNPYPTCAEHYLKSSVLSRFVLDEFCAQTGILKLNVREMDDMTGTNWSRVPTTILEMGFLSNKSDDTYMLTDYFRQSAAFGVANGLDDYFEWLDSQEELETQPVTEAPTEPPTEVPTEPSTEPSTEPFTETSTETSTEEITGEPTEETTGEPTEETTGEPTEETTGEPTEETTGEPTEETTGEPTEETTGEPTEETTGEPTEETTGEPTEETTGEPTEETTGELIEETTGEPTEETTGEPAEETTGEPTEETTEESAEETTEEFTREPIEGSMGESAEGTTEELTREPTEGSMGESAEESIEEITREPIEVLPEDDPPELETDPAEAT